MCTLIVATQVWPEKPLLVAANRDEQLSRASAPPKLWEGQGIFAPVDLVAGGSWLGLNRHGMFVGITNRFGVLPDKTRTSRGSLVLDALQCHTVAEAVSQVESVGVAQYNPFHLVIADRQVAHVVWSDNITLHSERLEPGISVITERSFGAAQSMRVQTLVAEAQNLERGALPLQAELSQLLSRHAEPGFEGNCVHVSELDYGTRSSTVVGLGLESHAIELWHAHGPPCREPYLDLSSEAVRMLHE